MNTNKSDADVKVKIGDPVIVKGYKAHSDGTSETPGIVNGVTPNPTAKELEDERAANKAAMDAATDPVTRNALMKPVIPRMAAEVSPCALDIAAFPKGGDHSNIEAIPFFTSRAAALKFFHAQPSATKTLNGPQGCVAYVQETFDPKAEEKALADQAAADRKTVDAQKKAEEKAEDDAEKASSKKK